MKKNQNSAAIKVQLVVFQGEQFILIDFADKTYQYVAMGVNQ